MATDTKKLSRGRKPIKPRKARVFSVCTRCTEITGAEVRHHPFAQCADGVRLKAAPTFTSENNPRKKKPESVPDPAPVSEAASPVSKAVADLREMIGTLPEGDATRASLELLLAREEAREVHAEREERLRADSGNPDARLPLPTILRDPKESKGRALLAELARVQHAAGQSEDPRSRPRLDEATLVHDMLATKNERDAAKESAARDAAKVPERIPGEAMWQCQAQSCGAKFKSLTLEQVKKKARMEPGWRGLNCPSCGGFRVLELTLVAA